METLQDILKEIRLGELDKIKIETGKGINSARADVISQLMDFMGEHKLEQLLFGASPKMRREYEEIKDDPGILSTWARDVYSQRFRYWIAQTKHLTPSAIHALMKRALQGRSPEGLFRYLLKTTRGEKV